MCVSGGERARSVCVCVCVRDSKHELRPPQLNTANNPRNRVEIFTCLAHFSDYGTKGVGTSGGWIFESPFRVP